MSRKIIKTEGNQELSESPAHKTKGLNDLNYQAVDFGQYLLSRAKERIRKEEIRSHLLHSDKRHLNNNSIEPKYLQKIYS